MVFSLPPSRARRRPSGAVALLTAALLSLGLAGCGGATHATGGSTPSSSSTSRSTSTGSGLTTTTSTTSAALPGTGKPVVTIGDKNYTEQFVLGQLWLKALEAQGFKVNITQNIGPTSVVRGALLKEKSLGMYPEYLNTFDESFAHYRQTFSTRAAAYAAGVRWASRHGLTLLTPTPFSDTDAIAVTDIYGADHDLHTLGELSRVASTLELGGAEQFKTDREGVNALETVYGIEPASFVALAVGGQYAALDAGTVQAAYVNTTDGELTTGDYRLLGDPEHIFGFGNVVPVVSDTVLVQEGPAFQATIERVDRTLTLQTMRELNAAASVTGASPAAVAAQYLETRGLLTPLKPSDY